MIKIKLFAGTDVGLRDNNEDNFTVCPDLTLDKWMIPSNQQDTIPLGKKGCLIVVADGMGGMNAGEVASDIAIKTVQQMFAPAVLPADVLGKPESMKSYLKKVIIQADIQVKQHCKEDPETEGMGSTIVIAWLYESNAYVAWLGDSRAYSFVPNKGISRLSKDHSYVQQLVDANIISEEEAMDHPQSNVITRSLGDTSQKAKPDVISHPVQAGEIILLCSDGLCGVCTDAEISDIIQMHQNDLQTCKEVLTDAALKAGGSDNITEAFIKIQECDGPVSATKRPPLPNFHVADRWQDALFIIFGLFLISALSFAGFKTCKREIGKDALSTTDSLQVDTAQQVVSTIIDVPTDTAKKATPSTAEVLTDTAQGTLATVAGQAKTAQKTINTTRRSSLKEFQKRTSKKAQQNAVSSENQPEIADPTITSSPSTGPGTPTKVDENNE